MFALVVFGDVETAPANPIYSFTTINAPGAGYFGTFAYGINSSGQIVGTVFTGSRPGFCCEYGFLDTGGSFTTIAGPGAEGTDARGINNNGQIVGIISVFHGGLVGFVDTGGSFAYIGPNRIALGINDSSQIVGRDGNDGFVDTGGIFTTIDVPGGMFTTASGINNSGQIVGQFTDAFGLIHGFVDMGGSVTTVDVPGATSTEAFGINDSGQIVGIFYDAFGAIHGFVDTGGSFTTVDVPGSTLGTTIVNGINDSGQVVGYFSIGGADEGFLATPVATPEPPSLLTLATCLVALLAIACRRKRAGVRKRPTA
jgi:uncharacterized membrane protein